MENIFLRKKIIKTIKFVIRLIEIVVDGFALPTIPSILLKVGLFICRDFLQFLGEKEAMKEKNRHHDVITP